MRVVRFLRRSALGLQPAEMNWNHSFRDHKKALLLFAALLVAGCGEKSSSEGSDSVGDSAEASADATHESEKPLTVPLSDADVTEPVVAEVVVDGDQIQFRGGIIEQDGLAYFEGEPFTGVAVWKYTAPNPNGQKWNEITYKDGNKHGLETYWYENGQKQSEHTFKEHKEHGPGAAWYENGQTAGEWNFNDGRKDGREIYWHENGQKKSEGIYKDGEEISVK